MAQGRNLFPWGSGSGGNRLLGRVGGLCAWIWQEECTPGTLGMREQSSAGLDSLRPGPLAEAPGLPWAFHVEPHDLIQDLGPGL